MLAPHTKWFLDLLARCKAANVRTVYLPEFRFDAIAYDLAPAMLAHSLMADGSLTLFGVRVCRRAVQPVPQKAEA